MFTREQSISHLNYWPPKSSKIATCMSGGVDSSVTAYLTAKQGYETVGLTGWLIKGAGRCCDNGMIDAAKVCEQIGINHISKDLRVFFKNQIVDPFINSYSMGSTPIPCITCNTAIKWGVLMDYAFEELKTSHIATGHYAKLVEDKGVFKIFRSKDTKKDQTFMLWGLNQEVLSRTVFPLGDLTKEEVRDIAREAGLLVADKEESQDICFVSSEEGTQGFLSKYLQSKEGFIIENKTGNVLGTHSGTYNFTVGQRKGLKVAYTEPLYVIDLDIEKNIVYAGTKEELDGYKLIANGVNWICPVETRLIASLQDTASASLQDTASASLQDTASASLQDTALASLQDTALASLQDTASAPLRVMAKVRYNGKTAPATVYILGENKVEVVFDEPQSAITPGQACVFYDETDQELLGGSWIEKNISSRDSINCV